MKENKSILIIDDDEDYCTLVKTALKESYECHVAFSGKEGIQAFNENEVSVAIVDLDLPDMNGFEVCKTLDQSRNNKRHDFSLFVITGDDELKTKLNAFEMGADDYISKPFELKELHSRIRRSITYLENKKALIKEGNDTRDLANTAMAQASKYSYVMNFFKQLNHCKDQDQVADKFFEAMSFFNFDASICIDIGTPKYYTKNIPSISPIEKNIYEMLKDSGRLYPFGRRLLVNDKSVSFLVKNVPTDEQESGEARDFLASLIEGIESKLQDLKLKSGIYTSINELQDTINSIKDDIRQTSDVTSSVMTDMITEISASFHSLEMTERQEMFFTKLIEQGAQKMNGSAAVLEKILADLELLKENLVKVKSESESKVAEEESSNTIDLF